jgi:hypothetical protein
VFGINSAKQVVKLCETSVAKAVTTVGPDTRKDFECVADLGNYKGPSGSMIVFAWFVSNLYWIAAKTQFLNWLLGIGAPGSAL